MSYNHQASSSEPAMLRPEARLKLVHDVTGPIYANIHNSSDMSDDDDVLVMPDMDRLMLSLTQRRDASYSSNNHSKPQDQMFTFVLPNDSNSIQVSEDGTLIHKLFQRHTRGQHIAHLNRSLGVGQELVLRIEQAARRIQSEPAFMLGFTMCDLTDGHKIDIHRLTCGSHSVCQRSFAQTIAQFACVNSVIRIKRTNKSIVIEIQNGNDKRDYAMKFSNLPKEKAAHISPDPTYYPFVVLSGSADALKILNSSDASSYGSAAVIRPSSPAASEVGMWEAAERQIKNLIRSPIKSTVRPTADPVPRASNWASLLKTSSPFKETTRVSSQYRFYPTPYAGSNMTVLQDGKLLKIRSQSGCRYAYVSRPFTCDKILAIKVEKEVASYLMCSHSFVVGLTTCDRETVLTFATHADGFCNSSRPCGGSCGYHSIPSNAHRGSIVYMERKSEPFEHVIITITGRQSWRIETLKVPDAFANVDVYPMVEMSGAADEISIVDVSSVPKPDVSKVTKSNPRFAMSMPRNEAHFSSAPDHEYDAVNETSDKIKFWDLPYTGNGVEISADNMKVRRTARIGARHVYFTREIEIGMSVVLKVTAGGGKLAPFRFEFGFTSCSPKAVMQEPVHMDDICSRSACRGMSHTVGLKYVPGVVEMITITRKPDLFVIDAGKGMHHRRFFKHLPDGCTPKDRWFPFLTLTGDVAAVEITDSWMRPESRRRSSTSLSNELDTVATCSSAAITAVKNTSPVSENNDTSPTESVKSASKAATRAVFEGSFERMPVSLPSSFRKISQQPNPVSPTVSRTVVNGNGNLLIANAAGDCVTDAQRSQLPNQATRPVPQTVTTNVITKRKWFNNSVVKYRDPFISRIDDSDDSKGYIFSSKMQINEKIGFTVNQVEGMRAKLVFGVTTAQLLSVDVTTLPVDAGNLTNHPNWFVYPHLATCVGVAEGLVVTRTDCGISLQLFQDPESEHKIISGIDASVTVFPFFQLSGCVIELLPNTE